MGRFAPSPTGRLHLGNLRTAMVAWLSARHHGGQFLVRMEDLDRVTSSTAHEAAQLADLAALGLDWDGPVVRQSERFGLYDDAIARLDAAGRLYECFCTRREIREAASAPHGDLTAGDAYPGTCRRLSAAGREARRAEGRPPALRLDAEGEVVQVADDVLGVIRLAVDDVVVRRNDGVPAYNLAVVVDDAAQGVTEVVRGDDLATSTPRQVLLQRLLGLVTPRYRHVPLVLGGDGQRLAKRHGAVTLADMADAIGLGIDAVAVQVRSLLAVSIGVAEPGETVTMGVLAERFDLAHLPREPWVLP
ncbi:MAG TPA: tRNA glutamyl-Q(34) synthetase GluQRS, partial [Ilumatobacteraceae bacterium]|nr:tRNA glutamyl-Q(34) synthetase GluQRS [Ilumatobacteraceae bacterium]